MSEQMISKREAAVVVAQLQIEQDVAAGVVPATVGSFSELHDYVDANEYGNLDEAGVDEDKWLPFANAVQGDVDAWLRSGALQAPRAR